MAKRPAFQFYPADWRNNAKLRRCSLEARGGWLEVLCLMHDSDEYGICRWPLEDIVNASGVPLTILQELIRKDVLKGADQECPAFIYTPRHAGKDGDSVTLVPANPGPCWYSSRMVRDEYVRQARGASTRFTADQFEGDSPKGAIGWPLGTGFGDGSSSSSSSSVTDSGGAGKNGAMRVQVEHTPKTPDRAGRAKPAAPVRRKADPITDEWLAELQREPHYRHVQIRTEFGKCETWYKAKRKQLNRAGFINWINRIEGPPAVSPQGSVAAVANDSGW